MPALTIHHMTFHSGLHVGGPRDNPADSLGGLPADTIFAALLDAWRRSGEDPAAFAAPFVARPPDPPFCLTSAFPFAGAVRFYPMPVDRGALFSPQTRQTHGKALRRIAFLSEALFRRALAGERLDAWLFPAAAEQEPDQGVALQGGRYWLAVEEIAGLPNAMQRREGRRHALRNLAVDDTAATPRVTLDRLSSASQIYQVGRTTFAPGCGLWFGVEWRTPDQPVYAGGPSYRSAVERLLHMLAEDGVGGDRASGYGAFALDTRHEALHLPAAGNDAVAWLLSRYHPVTDAELNALRDARAAYGLVTVGGWLRSPDGPAQRRRKLTLLTEGSQLPLRALPAGDVADVRPVYAADAPRFPHPVYRYGLALAAGRKEVAHG